jgi:hypothetical protein
MHDTYLAILRGDEVGLLERRGKYLWIERVGDIGSGIELNYKLDSTVVDQIVCTSFPSITQY